MTGHSAESATRESATDAAANAADAPFLARVVVTGASGFVGTAVVRELVARGHKAVCLVRNREKLAVRTDQLAADRYEIVEGDLFDDEALQAAVVGAEACIHLAGVIFQRRWAGQTFRRVHVEATRRVLDACQAAGVRRIAHMSALGARPDAVSRYHRTKFEAEGLVRSGGLDWTIFRPSIIHGPYGEFMRLMKTFVAEAWVPALGVLPSPIPVIPCFGDGMNKLQPIDVTDVAHCMVASLSMPTTIGRVFACGGPKAITWRDLYRICREKIPGAKSWKPVVGLPVWLAKALALSPAMLLPILPGYMRFNVDQVQMSQEDSVCDTAPLEQAFGIRLRDFETELARYAPLIPGG
jgi:NADH dehydrogenase